MIPLNVLQFGRYTFPSINSRHHTTGLPSALYFIYLSPILNSEMAKVYNEI
jgi:hypothetical protein